ncbi:MAG: leucine-rich repeat protein [Oscillospiraceae bacterium]|nr:leucine-rich repeat protein [Oscillospiraceae bacterium]
MSNASDFVIENSALLRGVLSKYIGDGGDVVIPDNVRSIGGGAFSGCKSLTSITIPDSVHSIGWKAFSGCKNLSTITIPSSVESISGLAFEDCVGLTSITIPHSVRYIDETAFRNCKALADRHGFLILHGMLFGYFGNASDVTIPDSVDTIGAEAFKNCKNLASIKIPDSVTSISDEALSNGSNLPKMILSVTAGSFVTKLFRYSDALRIDIPDISALPAKFRICAALCFAEDGGNATDPRYESHSKYLKANSGKIAEIAVQNLPLLTLLCREGWIKAKDIEAYTDAVQKTGDAEKIAMILDYQTKKLTAKQKEKVVRKKEKQEDTVFERAVVRMDQEDISGLNFALAGKLVTFKDQKELKKFIEDRGGKLLSAMSANVDFLIMNKAAGNSEKKKQAEELRIEIITEQQFNEKVGRNFWIYPDGTLFKYIGAGGDVTIPDNVTTIGEAAFENCKNLIAVTIPDSVKTIGKLAFHDCKKLKAVTIGKNTTIGYGAFTGCKGLTDKQGFVIVRGVLYNYYGKASSITIPECVTIIEDSAFADCESLTVVTIGGNITTIGIRAFAGCKNLATVNIEHGVTTIDYRAFSVCKSLTAVNIDSSVNTISGYAFQGSKHVTIHAPAGSYAETYAKENNIPFIAE